MAIEEVRIYELADEQTMITDTDLGVLDKSGYTRAKKFTMLNLYNYVKNKLTGSFTGKAFHKLYVKSDETGLQFKGNVSDYTPLNIDELDDLNVEVSKTSLGTIVANAMTSVKGLMSNTIRNTAIGVPPATAKVPYYDIDGEVLGTVEIQDIGGGADTNIYNTDGALTANRTISTPDYSFALYNTTVSANHYKVSRRNGFTTFDLDTNGATVRYNFLALTGTYQQGAIEGNNGLLFYSQGSPDGGTPTILLDSGKFGLKPFTIATLPSVSNPLGNGVMNGVILVTDATPRPTIAYSNGTNWIDIQTGVAVV